MSNSLTVEQLRSQLSALGVDNRGHRNELKARLRRQQRQRLYVPHQDTSSTDRSSEPKQFTIQQRRPIVAAEGATIGNGNGSSQADSAKSWRRLGAAIPPQETVFISKRPIAKPEPVDVAWKPIMDSYLVLDVEATCERGKLGQPRNASFEFPNESELRRVGDRKQIY
jgi:hypothetical protein